MFAAARKGDPITHDTLVPSGVIAPPATGPCPRGVVMIESLPAAHVACSVACTGAVTGFVAHPPLPPPGLPIVMGSLTVLIHNLPAARWTPSMDTGICGVFLGDVKLLATRRTLIGGPQFTLPPVIKLEGPPVFQEKVVRDLYLLSTLPSGKELLDRLGKAGQTITIKPFSGDNSYCSPVSGSDAKAGKATGSVIQYNPDLDKDAFDSAGNRIAMSGAVLLGHEMVHALNNAEGTHRYGTDPSPPASEPSIDQEEAAAIGTGSHSAGRPTENTLRSDLGLPRRDNHYWTNPGGPGSPPRLNIRPGT